MTNFTKTNSHMLKELLTDLLGKTKSATLVDDGVTYEWHPENSTLVVLRPYRKLSADEVRRVGDVLGFLGKHSSAERVARTNPKTGTLYGCVWKFPRKREPAPVMEALL